MAKTLADKRGRKLTLTWAKLDAFLELYAKSGDIVESARALQMSPHRHYEAMADPEYKEKFAKAQSILADSLEAEAIRRARDGVLRKKFDKGQPLIDPETGQQYIEREYSDTLLIFKLKALRPEKYRERVQQDIRFDDLPAEKLLEMLKALGGKP